MTDEDRQLVQIIAQQVIAILQQRGLIGDGAGDSRADRAAIQPPAGVCTGDYSKFPELAGRLSTPPPEISPPPPPGVSPGESVPVRGDGGGQVPLTGIVTANQLQEAMDGSPDGVALLAGNARLTPLANDLARQHPQRVRRADALGGAAAADPQALPWLWWMDGACPAAQQIVAQRAARLCMCSAGRGPGSLAQVARDLAAALRSGRVAGGLLFVQNAARAMCYLNRCSAVRAVVGTCGEAVEQGVSELGANVLVIETPHHGPRAMATMVDRILQQRPRPPAAVERDLANLHRCV